MNSCRRAMVNSFRVKIRIPANLSVLVYETTSVVRAIADAAIVAIYTTLLMICLARESQKKNQARLKEKQSVDEATHRLV